MRHHIGAVVVLVGGILFAFNERAAAQGPSGPPPNYQQLVGEIAALQTQVPRYRGRSQSSRAISRRLTWSAPIP